MMSVSKWGWPGQSIRLECPYLHGDRNGRLLAHMHILNQAVHVSKLIVRHLSLAFNRSNRRLTVFQDFSSVSSVKLQTQCHCCNILYVRWPKFRPTNLRPHAGIHYVHVYHMLVAWVQA